MRFPLARGESYLTTELADALVDAGHEVEAVQLDWDAPPGGESERLTSARGISVLRICPRAIGRPGSLVWPYAFSDQPLIGEQIFAAGAYMGQEASQKAALVTLEVLRWLLIVLLILAAIVQSNAQLAQVFGDILAPLVGLFGGRS
jgi:hypothetical protein